MARVIMPNTDRILANSNTVGQGYKFPRNKQGMEVLGNVINTIDKYSESGALTMAAQGLSALGGKVKDLYNGPEQLPTELEILRNAGEEEKQAYAAMSPEQKTKYLAAKTRAMFEAEKATGEETRKSFYDQREAYANEELKSYNETKTKNIPNADSARAVAVSIRKLAAVETDPVTKQRLIEESNGFFKEASRLESEQKVKDRVAVASETQKYGNVFGEASPAQIAPVAPQMPSTPSEPNKQVVPPTVSGITNKSTSYAPEAQREPPFEPAVDYVSMLNQAVTDKEKQDILDSASKDLMARAASAGLTAPTAPTQVDVASTTITPTAPTTVPYEDMMNEQYKELEVKYGLDRNGAERFLALQDMGLSPAPGDRASKLLDSQEKIYAAATSADTPEKQKVVIEALKDIKLKPKNVFEAFGMVDDPERNIKYAKEVIAMFPKKSATELAYDRLNKLELIRSKRAKTATEDVKRPYVAGQAQANINKTEAGTGAVIEGTRKTAAQTRTEDFLRETKLAEKVTHMAAETKKAEAALKAASRPRAGRTGVSAQSKVLLEDAKNSAAAAARAYAAADAAEKAAAEATKQGGSFTNADETEYKRLSKEASNPTITPAEGAAKAKATQAFNAISTRRAKFQAAGAAAKGHKDNAATYKNDGDRNVRNYSARMEQLGVKPNPEMVPQKPTSTLDSIRDFFNK